MDRVSMLGFTFLLGDTPVSWSSQRQKTIAMSTVESEYIALCSAAKQAVWLRNLYNEMVSQIKGLEKAETVTMMGDNQGSHALANNPLNHGRTKHIDIQYHYIRHLIERKDIAIEYCPMEEMLADSLTKPLAKPAFEKEVEKLFSLSIARENGIKKARKAQLDADD